MLMSRSTFCGDMQRRDEKSREMRGDEEEEGGGRRRRDGRMSALLTNHARRKAERLILKVPEAVAANRGVKGDSF